jgi:hypothetical protein
MQGRERDMAKRRTKQQVIEELVSEVGDVRRKLTNREEALERSEGYGDHLRKDNDELGTRLSAEQNKNRDLKIKIERALRDLS